MSAVRTFDTALPHGVTLACRAAGQGSVQALLLHGFPEAAFAWDEVLERLAPRHAALAPNQRGYVGSSAPEGDAAYRARHLVTDLVALIEQLGAPLPLLVAHDWGGAVAWNLAAQRPGLIRRLLIINSPHPATFLRELRDDAEQQAASAYMNFLVRPDAAALLAEDDFRRLWPFFGGAAWLDEATREHYRQAWRNGGRGLDPMLAWYRASPLRPGAGESDPLHRIELPDDAVTVPVPTTVLWGEQDVALRPGLLRGLERWVPQLALRRVPEGTHWLVHEQPALVAATIAEQIDLALAPR
jgi:pimeloyl-ACP methyl ester carboxylesterase